MQGLTVFRLIFSIGPIFMFLAACTAPAAQQPTLVPQTPTSTIAAATQTAGPSMETVWKTTGSPNPLILPTELAVDSQGNVYVIDGGNHRVQKFDKDGNFLLSWGGPGAGDGQFLFQASPAHYGSITIDKDGYVYVSDHHNRVQKFDGDGNFVMKFGDTGYADGKFYTLYGLAIDDQGNIYTTDWTKYEIQKFNSRGEFLQKWEVPSCQPGGISSPYNLVVDAQGQLYVTQQTGNCIQKFDNQGSLLRQWGELGNAEGQLNKPLSMALDPQGNIYVSDNENGRVQKFDPGGNFMAVYEPFDYPVGIAVDDQGYVYVAEIVRGQIQKLRLQ